MFLKVSRALLALAIPVQWPIATQLDIKATRTRTTGCM